MKTGYAEAFKRVNISGNKRKERFTENQDHNHNNSPIPEGAVLYPRVCVNNSFTHTRTHTLMQLS